MFDENILLFAVNLFVIFLCGGLFLLMPQLTRKSYLFGVIIPSEQSSCPEARAMKRNYTLICFLGVLVMLFVCLTQFITRRDMTLLTTIYLPLFIIPIGLIAFVPNWKRALRLKEERCWQVTNILPEGTSASHTHGYLSALPWIWYILSFVSIAAVFVAGIIRYPTLPGMIAGHMDVNLQPTLWVEKTWWSVLMIPVFAAGTLALMILVAITIEKAKLQIDPAKPRLSFAQHRVYRRRMGHVLGFMTLVVILFMVVLWLPVIFPDSPVWGTHIFWASMGVLGISITVLILVQIKTGQGGCKVKIDVGGENTDNQMSPSEKSNVPGFGGANNDKYWILGMFYHNGEDPAYIVEDRFGTNIGFNYARLAVKIGAALLLLGIIVLYVWLTKQIWNSPVNI